MSEKADEMSLAALRELYDADQRRGVEYAGTRREEGPGVVRLIDLAGEQGVVIFSALDEATADGAIAAEKGYFERLGQDLEWKLYSHDRPADLRERLAVQGFEIDEAEAIMVLDLEGAPESLFDPGPHHVQRIHDPALLPAVLGAKAEASDGIQPWLLDSLARELQEEPDQISVYGVQVDGQWVSSAWVRFPVGSQFASLWGGSTLPAYRRRGIYGSLLATRARETRARGRRFLTIDASPMSRPIVERHGFVQISTSYPCLWRVRRDPATDLPG